MTGYTFQELTPGWPSAIASGTWLWIWNADKVPPHIGISRGQNYFSLTYKTCEVQKNVAGMVRKAKRSAIPLVLVDLSAMDLRYDFTAIFQQYERAAAGGPTCLSPVKQVLGCTENVHQLADLLTQIERQGMMQQVFAVHLDEAYRGIPAYTVTEIMQRIEELHEVKGAKGTVASR